MLIGSFEVLKKAGCIQCEHDHLRSLFRVLMASMFRDPCITGCPAFKDGKCEAYQKHNTNAKLQRAEDEKSKSRARALEDATTPQHGTGEWAGMTIRQIAKAEEISLNEARRRKQRGDYSS